MMRIFVTTEFCNECQKLVNSNFNEAVHNLRTVLILLANGRPIPKKFKDHQLTDSPYRELHISGDVLLLYRYEASSDCLVVSLKLSDVVNHKSLRTKIHKDKHEYFEVDTEYLHNITSSIVVSNTDEDFLNDFLESISDYVSIELDDGEGYVLLSDYYFEGDNLHCIYSYISYLTSKEIDSIDFIIDTTKYCTSRITELTNYMDDFIREIAYSFYQD